MGAFDNLIQEAYSLQNTPGLTREMAEERWNQATNKYNRRVHPNEKQLSRQRGGLKGEIIPEGYRRGKFQQYTPEQIQLLEQLMGQLDPEGYTSRLARGDQELFQEMEAPALRQFGELQGNIASRFSGQGIGARGSSGFQNTLNSAASQFSQDLASKRQNLQRQAILDLQGMGRELLQERPYENFLTKKQYPQQQQESSGDWLSGLLGGGSGALTGYASGGIPGAVAGGATGFYRGYKGGF